MRFLLLCALVALTCTTLTAATPHGHGKCFTRWFDRDDPTGTGDWETVRHLRKQFPKEMCRHPTGIEAVTINGTKASHTGNMLFSNDEISGLICKNSDQERGSCEDYKVRFVCPPPFCESQTVCWTNWYDRDDPAGSGDWESLSHLQKRNPDQICANPIRIEARTVDTKTPACMTGQEFLYFTPGKGLACKNMPFEYCYDYEVRFGCPCETGPTKPPMASMGAQEKVTEGTVQHT